jgi:transcriptional regulator with XRE-family HTH domain
VAKGVKPNVRQRRVAVNLRAWRKATGRNLEDVAETLQWSGAKLSRFERAEVNAGPAEIIALAAILSVPEAARDKVVALAVGSMKSPGFWLDYAPDVVPTNFADYLETEAEATAVFNVETLLIPGLLQSPAYTDAIIRARFTAGDEPIVREERGQLRQQRQARLDAEDNPLELHVIIHEAALRQPIGGAQIMTEQLALLEIRAQQPNITIQVIPESVGAYPGIGPAYIALTFDGDHEAAAVYLDNLTSGHYVEDPDEVGGYTLNFERLATHVALDPPASIQFIITARQRMGAQDKE